MFVASQVYALDWGNDNSTLVSASQDGKLLIWNAFTEAKKDAVSLKSAWVMAAAFDKEEQRFVAAGGLDNIASVYDLRNPVVPAYELVGHDGYLSSCKFVNKNSVITSSGDSTCILWDAERATKKHTFSDHSADVMRCGARCAFVRLVLVCVACYRCRGFVCVHARSAGSPPRHEVPATRTIAPPTNV
jgi:guanine nucleotide-binding protein G(I)/G(S)/G(T) subunit beta-1